MLTYNVQRKEALLDHQLFDASDVAVPIELLAVELVRELDDGAIQVFAGSAWHAAGELVDFMTALRAAVTDGRAEKAIPVVVGVPTPPPAIPMTPERQQILLTYAVQMHMDSKAREYGYDDVFSATTYADEPAVPKFQAEGQAFRAWRSNVWATCYQLLDEVKNGVRPVPTEDELVSLLPPFVPPT